MQKVFEIWKDVVGFENLYQVSNMGNVKVLEHDVDYGNRICHRNERFLKLHYDSCGYLLVKLKDNKQHRVSRLVAEAFLGSMKDMEVDHINGKRDDNRVENLRWVIHQENVSHIYELGNGHFGKKYNYDHYAKTIMLYNEKDQIVFSSILECCEWIQKHILKTTKIGSIYCSLRKHNINKKAYCGYFVNY